MQQTLFISFSLLKCVYFIQKSHDFSYFPLHLSLLFFDKCIILKWEMFNKTILLTVTLQMTSSFRIHSRKEKTKVIFLLFTVWRNMHNFKCKTPKFHIDFLYKVCFTWWNRVCIYGGMNISLTVKCSKRNVRMYKFVCRKIVVCITNNEKQE